MERDAVQRIGRRLWAQREPVEDSDVGFGGESEDRRLVAVEVHETGAAMAGEHNRTCRSDDRCSGAAFGRPQREQHSPSSCPKARAATARGDRARRVDAARIGGK